MRASFRNPPSRTDYPDSSSSEFRKKRFWILFSTFQILALNQNAPAANQYEERIADIHVLPELLVVGLELLSMATGKARASEDCGRADANWTSQNFVANSPV